MTTFTTVFQTTKRKSLGEVLGKKKKRKQTKKKQQSPQIISFKSDVYVRNTKTQRKHTRCSQNPQSVKGLRILSENYGLKHEDTFWCGNGNKE